MAGSDRRFFVAVHGIQLVRYGKMDSIAEAFYSVSATMRAECRDRIDVDLLDILELFDKMIGK